MPTVTPGKTWSNESITPAKLNETAQPSVSLDDEDVEGRHLNVASVLTTLGDALRGTNLAMNPTTTLWHDTSGVSVSAGDRGTNAVGWHLEPAGAAVNYNRVESHPTTGDAAYLWKYAIHLEGASSVTTVDLGQFVSSHVAERLVEQTITVSAYINNLTGASLTMDVRIDAASTRDDASTGSNVASASFDAVAAGSGWTRISKSVDLSGLSNIANGFEVKFRVPSGGLDDGTKDIYLGGLQIEKSSAVSALAVPPISLPFAHSTFNQASEPDSDDDLDKGFDVGSLFILSTGAIYVCQEPDDGAAVWVGLGGGGSFLDNQIFS